MNYPLRCLTLTAILLYSAAAVHAQRDNLSADAILQRAIDSAGGDRLLSSVTSMDMIQQVVSPGKKDTMYFAVKQRDGNKYLLSMLGVNVQMDNSLTIFNDGRAVTVDQGFATSMIDPARLELLRVSASLSMDYAYKKMGFKLTRGNDEHYQDLDCYTLFLESPHGQKTINYYDKKSGHLLMIIYENLYKTVYLDYYKQRGVSIPLRTLMLDPNNEASETAIVRIDDDPIIDTGWFHIPAEGRCKPPVSFRTGSFSGLQENKPFTVVRVDDRQRVTIGSAQTEYTINWIGAAEYLLIGEDGTHRCRIINWVGDKCYCHCVGASQAEATYVLQKTP